MLRKRPTDIEKELWLPKGKGVAEGIKQEFDIHTVGCLAVLSQSVVSNSLQAHGLQPDRFLCPGDSPGKNTGVGGHALLQGYLPNPGIEPRSPALQADSFFFFPCNENPSDLVFFFF